MYTFFFFSNHTFCDTMLHKLTSWYRYGILCDPNRDQTPNSRAYSILMHSLCKEKYYLLQLLLLLLLALLLLLLLLLPQLLEVIVTVEWTDKIPFWPSFEGPSVGGVDLASTCPFIRKPLDFQHSADVIWPRAHWTGN